MHACMYEPSVFVVVVYKHVIHNGIEPIKHCAKFEVCNYVLKYWEYFLNWLRVFVVVYKHLIEM